MKTLNRKRSSIVSDLYAQRDGANYIIGIKMPIECVSAV
jgi:hypothetical protein